MKRGRRGPFFCKAKRVERLCGCTDIRTYSNGRCKGAHYINWFPDWHPINDCFCAGIFDLPLSRTKRLLIVMYAFLKPLVSKA